MFVNKHIHHSLPLVDRERDTDSQRENDWRKETGRGEETSKMKDGCTTTGNETTEQGGDGVRKWSLHGVHLLE